MGSGFYSAAGMGCGIANAAKQGPETLPLEGVEKSGAGSGEVIDVSCHDSQVVNHRGCSDQLVQHMLVLWYAKTPPQLPDVYVHGQNVSPIITENTMEPVFKTCRLWPVTPVPNYLNTPPQFPNGNNGDV